MNLVQAMSDQHLFEPFFRGPSWDNWKIVLKATCGMRLDRQERNFFSTIAERDPPKKPVRELWAIAGRRAGKDSIASMICAHRASVPQYLSHVRPGEVPLVQCLAVDKNQATIVKGYARAYFDKIPLLSSLKTKKEHREGFILSNGVELAVKASNFRVVRGRAIPCAVFDEVSFWADEDSVSPDTETYAAVVPGMATMPDPLLVGISTPYRKSGLLYNKFRASFGQPDDEVLVIRAPSTALNPTLDQRIIDEAMERDPIAAASEWMAEWRNDISGYLDPAVIDAVVAPGRHELPPMSAAQYVGFVDPSGGSSDSMTLAICHREKDGRVILDCVRDVRPPFSPAEVVTDFAKTLKSYHLPRVMGDRYGGEWCREPFRKAGITYDLAEQPKSGYYLDCLPLINSARVELLDNKRLIAQFVGLERRTARSGKDSIDHAPGGHDDLANAVAGALVTAANKPSAMVFTSEAIARMRRAPPRSTPVFI